MICPNDKMIGTMARWFAKTAIWFRLWNIMYPNGTMSGTRARWLAHMPDYIDWHCVVCLASLSYECLFTAWKDCVCIRLGFQNTNQSYRAYCLIGGVWKRVSNKLRNRFASWEKNHTAAELFKINIVTMIIWHPCQSSGMYANHLSFVAFIWSCCQSPCCTCLLSVWMHAPSRRNL